MTCRWGTWREMRKLLVAAKRAGHIQTRGDVGFWVTEFSYDSKPADPKGLSLELHARWTSEALYRMWSNGVTHVTWFLLRDEPFPDQYFQSGLYMRGASGIATDDPEAGAPSFRFPFVAFSEEQGDHLLGPVAVVGSREDRRRAAGREAVEARAPAHDEPVRDLQGKLAKAPGDGTRAGAACERQGLLPRLQPRPVKDFRFCPWGSFC